MINLEGYTSSWSVDLSIHAETRPHLDGEHEVKLSPIINVIELHYTDF